MSKRLTKRMDSGEWIADCKRQLAIDKLAEYENAEERDCFVKLPCKVGSYLYIPNFETGEVDSHRVKAIHISDSGHTSIILYHRIYFAESVGKYIFLTEEEARAVIGGNDG